MSRPRAEEVAGAFCPWSDQQRAGCPFHKAAPGPRSGNQLFSKSGKNLLTLLGRHPLTGVEAAVSFPPIDQIGDPPSWSTSCAFSSISSANSPSTNAVAEHRAQRGDALSEPDRGPEAGHATPMHLRAPALAVKGSERDGWRRLNEFAEGAPSFSRRRESSERHIAKIVGAPRRLDARMRGHDGRYGCDELALQSADSMHS
jgi:hypothetical protein